MKLKNLIYLLLVILSCRVAKGQSYSSTHRDFSRFEKTSFGNKEEDINTFKGKIYEIPEGTDRLPNFTNLKPIGEIFTPQLLLKHETPGKYPGGEMSVVKKVQ